MHTELAAGFQLPFFVSLLILLALARVLGEIMERLRQPAMIGEIFAGIILGPSLFDLIQVSPELSVFAEMGVFLLIIMVGMEINISNIISGIRGRNFWTVVLGFSIPFIGGFAVMLGFFQMSVSETIFIALCLSITALPVSIRILMDLGKLNTEIGSKIIATAIVNDVFALMILGIALDSKIEMPAIGEFAKMLLWTLLKVALFILLVYLAFKAIQRLSNNENIVREKVSQFVSLLKSKESNFAIIFVFILLFAGIAELIGLHFIVGAFFGAMLLTSELLGKENYKQVEETTRSISMGFLAPIFFATIGLRVNITELSNLTLMGAILIIAFGSKIIGGYLGGRIGGMSHPEAYALGIGLNGRGIMELVVANIALTNGFITDSIFSILVLMGIITTLCTPILLKHAFSRINKPEYQDAGEGFRV
ncbi:MAG: cation:proton antiporter [Saprospiraceae bacterium]